ncbi:MAG: hypothetical protein N0E59_02265 [Candidatus Thiodiazotropha taylori]|nr:hypothetical protein [Candidatus Thiodiazotropha taylori]MCW4281908.1 hypothetical protein [Candidatus Thiodiazotropha taylori]
MFSRRKGEYQAQEDSDSGQEADQEAPPREADQEAPPRDEPQADSRSVPTHYGSEVNLNRDYERLVDLGYDPGYKIPTRRHRVVTFANPLETSQKPKKKPVISPFKTIKKTSKESNLFRRAASEENIRANPKHEYLLDNLEDRLKMVTSDRMEVLDKARPEVLDKADKADKADNVDNVEEIEKEIRKKYKETPEQIARRKAWLEPKGLVDSTPPKKPHSWSLLNLFKSKKKIDPKTLEISPPSNFEHHQDYISQMAKHLPEDARALPEAGQQSPEAARAFPEVPQQQKTGFQYRGHVFNFVPGPFFEPFADLDSNAHLDVLGLSESESDSDGEATRYPFREKSGTGLYDDLLSGYYKENAHLPSIQNFEMYDNGELSKTVRKIQSLDEANAHRAMSSNAHQIATQGAGAASERIDEEEIDKERGNRVKQKVLQLKGELLEKLNEQTQTGDKTFVPYNENIKLPQVLGGPLPSHVAGEVFRRYMDRNAQQESPMEGKRLTSESFVSPYVDGIATDYDAVRHYMAGLLDTQKSVLSARAKTQRDAVAVESLEGHTDLIKNIKKEVDGEIEAIDQKAAAIGEQIQSYEASSQEKFGVEPDKKPQLKRQNAVKGTRPRMEKGREGAVNNRISLLRRVQGKLDIDKKNAIAFRDKLVNEVKSYSSHKTVLGLSGVGWNILKEQNVQNHEAESDLDQIHSDVLSRLDKLDQDLLNQLREEQAEKDRLLSEESESQETDKKKATVKGNIESLQRNIIASEAARQSIRLGEIGFNQTLDKGRERAKNDLDMKRYRLGKR